MWGNKSALQGSLSEDVSKSRGKGKLERCRREDAKARRNRIRGVGRASRVRFAFSSFLSSSCSPRSLVLPVDDDFTAYELRKYQKRSALGTFYTHTTTHIQDVESIYPRKHDRVITSTAPNPIHPTTRLKSHITKQPNQTHLPPSRRPDPAPQS